MNAPIFGGGPAEIRVRSAVFTAWGVYVKASHDAGAVRLSVRFQDGSHIQGAFQFPEDEAWAAFMAQKILPLIRRKLTWGLAGDPTVDNLVAAAHQVRAIERIQFGPPANLTPAAQALILALASFGDRDASWTLADIWPGPPSGQ